MKSNMALSARREKILAREDSKSESDDMRRIRVSILLFVPVLAPALAWSRVVSSKADLERLRGFPAFQKEQAAADKERLSDVGDLEKDRAAWEKQKMQALEEYKRDRKKIKAALDESSPEYRDWLREQAEAKADVDENRENYISNRDRIRREERATIRLTEEREMGIDLNPERVDWKKRKFVAEAGGAGGRFSGSGGGTRTESPPPEFMGNVPPPPPPDFYESEPPPPPPPPSFDGMPPGGFDESIPPPVFDDPEF